MTARKVLALVVPLALAAPSVTVHADHGPTHLPDGTIVYGDWGLYRPGHMGLVYDGPLVIGAPRYAPSYFYPTNRDDPNAYRSRAKEFGPSMPAEPYFRSWGVQSESSDPKATEYAPFDPPEVIYAPQVGQRGRQQPRKKQPGQDQQQ